MTESIPKTYPETTIFRWESATYTRAQATALLRDLANQGGSKARRAALRAAADTLDEIADDRMIDTFTGAQMKKVLIAAAHDHQWWGRNTNKFELPKPKQPDTKACFRCKEVQPLAVYMVPPTAAQIKSYGMRSDTTRKIVGQVCAKCRKAKADSKRHNYLRRPRKDRTLPPEMADRLQAYKNVRRQLMAHTNRVKSRIYQVRKPLRTINETTGELEILYDYQFTNEATKDYYFTKRDMLYLVGKRLEALLGEDAPIPAKWSALLSKEEAHKLQDLHNSAFINESRPPALW